MNIFTEPRNLAAMLLAGLLMTVCFSTFAQGGSKGADNGKPFQDVQDAITSEEAARIAADEANAAIRDAALQSLQEQIDAANASLDELAGLSLSFDELQADVAALQSTMDTLTTDLDNLDAGVASNADAIANLLAELELLDGELAGKQDILDGACLAGSSLRVIYPDGGFLYELGGSTASTSVSSVVRVSSFLTVPRGTAPRQFEESCPSGFQIAGGGYEIANIDTRTSLNVLATMPLDESTWQITVSNTESLKGTERVRIRMVCVM